MKSALFIFTCLCLVACSGEPDWVYTSDWENHPDGPLSSPHLQPDEAGNWIIAQGELIPLLDVPDATRLLNFSQYRIAEETISLSMATDFTFSVLDTTVAAAGFLLAGNESGQGEKWQFIGIDESGQLVLITDLESMEPIESWKAKNKIEGAIHMELRIRKMNNNYEALVRVKANNNVVQFPMRGSINLGSDLSGWVFLLAHAEMANSATIKFEKWRIAGDGLVSAND